MQLDGEPHMPVSNFERMIALAEEFFEMKDDPDQLDIDENIIAQLHTIHPSTMGEVSDENGPIAWTIVIPTTNHIMQRFLEKTISEKELLELTLKESAFESLYLCSALVLPEHRGKGLAKDLVMESVRTIQNDHPITSLFYWGFSSEGEHLARKIGSITGLTLYQRV